MRTFTRALRRTRTLAVLSVLVALLVGGLVARDAHGGAVYKVWDQFKVNLMQVVGVSFVGVSSDPTNGNGKPTIYYNSSTDTFKLRDKSGNETTVTPANGNAVTIAGSQTITGQKTLTAPIIAGGVTASGSAANDLSGSTGAFKTSTGAVTVGPGVVSITGAIDLPVGAQSTTPYTLAATDYYVAITTGNSNFTVNLPACIGGAVGRAYKVKKVDSGTGAVVIAPNGADTIEGTNANAQFGGATSSGVSDSKGQFGYVELVCRSAGAWDVTSQYIGYAAALTSGTPSTWTVTVPTGARCTCTNATTQANPVKCAVSSTTLTATGINTNTDVVSATCAF